jgi:endonuclease YncB( thermonuclease family)
VSPAPPTETVTSPGQPALPEPVTLEHPNVIDTAKFTDGDKTVALFGIIGLPGEAAQGMQDYLASNGNRLTCAAKTSSDYVCLLPDGKDVAVVALMNGAARAKEDAPASYLEQEEAAQAARRGLWSSLPPPPVVVNHPQVKDTATLTDGTQTYVLDGVEGFGAPYAGQLQGYIAANGDQVTCQLQEGPGDYICLLPDGTDVAKVALVNGAAQVAADAPDSYRVQQRDALNHRRGYWAAAAPSAVTTAFTTVEQPSVCCALPPGDDGSDGVVYVGGEPTAVIDGTTVFLVFGGVAGWGYYDHGHHWHGAPDRYRSHLERFHPDGHGLRGYASAATRGPGGVAPGGTHRAGTPVGVPAPAAATPGGHPGAVSPGVRAAPPVPVVHPVATPHPAPAAPGYHPGPAVPGYHPGPAPAVPGYRPGPAAPGYRPGPAAPALRPSMPARPAPAPAMRAAPAKPVVRCTVKCR